MFRFFAGGVHVKKPEAGRGARCGVWSSSAWRPSASEDLAALLTGVDGSSEPSEGSRRPAGVEGCREVFAQNPRGDISMATRETKCSRPHSK